MFIRLHKTSELDGRTDGQTDRNGQKWSGYHSGLHCEQCGRAVKAVL